MPDNIFGDLIPAAPSTSPATASAAPPANPFADLIPSAPPSPAPSTAPATPQGLLTNNGSESWTSGALKGLGTAAVRGASMVAGIGGDLGNVLRMGEAGARSWRTGESYRDALTATNAAEDRNDAAFQRVTGVNPNLPDSGTVESTIENKTGVGRYDPTSTVGRVAQAGAAAAIGGGVSPEALAAGGLKAAGRAMVRDAGVNAAAGAGGQAALEGTQALGFGDGTQAVAGLAGGLVGSIGAGAMRSLGTRYTPAGRDAAVGADLLRSSSNPDDVRSTLMADAPAPLVAGSTPTTAELTGDAGLSVLQDRAATHDPATFNTREDQNNAARFDALRSTAPTDADAMAPAATFRDHLEAIQQAGQQVRDDMQDAHSAAVQRLNDAYSDDAAARSQAAADFSDQQRADLSDRMAGRQADLDADTTAQTGQTSAARDALVQSFSDRIQAAQSAADAGNARLGPAMPQDVAGQVLRDHLQAAADQEAAHTRALYNAVDPDGSLYAVATPAKQAVRDIRSSIDPIAGVQPSGVEADLHDAIRTMPDVVPFRSLQALDSRVGAAMADARRNPSAADPQALSRLTQLKGATLDAINNAVDHQRQFEADRVAAGVLHPSDTVDGRLGSYADRLGNSGGGLGRAGEAVGTVAAQPDGAARLRGTGSAPGRGPLDPAGVPGSSEAPPYNADRLTRPVPPAEARPQSLVDFVRAHGGVQDVGGDLKSMGLDSVPGVIAKPRPWGTPTGLHPDKMREAAAEAGYLGADTTRAVQDSTIGDLHDALSRNRPVYSVHDEDLAARWAAHDDARQHYNEHRDVPVNRPAGDARMREEIPLSAYADELGGERAEAGDAISPNMAESGAAERLAAAKAQHQISVAYKSGPVGEALKSAGYKGSYRMAPEGVARAATRDYSSAKAFLDGAKRAPEAVGHLGEVVTNDLRRRVGPTGEVGPNALAQWETQNAGALKALREVDPTFGRGLHEAGKANDALVALGQERAATLKAFELDAAARGADAFTKGRDSMRAANAADRAATAKSIADRRASDVLADREARGARDAGIAASKAETGAKIRAADDVLARAKKLPGAELAGKTDPSEVARFMGRLVEDKASGPTRARQFMASIQHDPAAVAGARKALVDHVVGRLENGAITSAGDRALSGPKLRTYLADHGAALQAVMPAEHLNAWHAVAADMARRDVVRAAARTVGSHTASRLLPEVEKASKAAAHAGHAAGGAAWILALESMFEHGLSWHSAGMAAVPFALGAGKKMATAALGRERKIRQGLLTEALLKPDVARHYVRAMGHDNPSAGAALVNTLRRGFTSLQAVR